MKNKVNCKSVGKTCLTGTIFFTLMFLVINTLNAQPEIGSKKSTDSNYNISRERYFTSGNGTILMNVNMWGHVNSPGRHTVFDGIDLATLLSVVGGPKSGAKLDKVKLFREVPDENGKQVYIINLKKFLKTGDRSEFMKILPNDTYIIPQTTASIILSNVGTVNTFLTLLTLYFQMLRYQADIG